MPNDDFQLIRCDESGAPERPSGSLPSEILDACAATAALYRRTGYIQPWVCYVAVSDGVPVGGGAFVGPPAYGRVEIAYLTAPEFRGRGIASRTAARLLAIARQADPDIAVFAKTRPEETASTAILRRLGFKMIGEVLDEDIGKAWRWLIT